MPINSDPVRGWPAKAGIKTGGPSVFESKSQTSSQPVLHVMSSRGATSIITEGYCSFNGGIYAGYSLQVNGPSTIYGYSDNPSTVMFRMQTQMSSGGDSIFTIIGNGKINAVANSAAPEVLRLQTRGATTKSFVIEDLRDNSTVLSIDTDGNFSGTSSATSWKTFTPTIYGSTWAIGNGTIQGRYTRIGKAVTFEIKVIFGTTSVYGSSGPLISIIPAGVTAAASETTPFTAIYKDTSTGSMYLGVGVIIPSYPNDAQMHTNASPMTQVINTTPFTWATGDSIVMTGTYETA